MGKGGSGPVAGPATGERGASGRIGLGEGRMWDVRRAIRGFCCAQGTKLTRMIPAASDWTRPEASLLERQEGPKIEDLGAAPGD